MRYGYGKRNRNTATRTTRPTTTSTTTTTTTQPTFMSRFRRRRRPAYHDEGAIIQDDGRAGVRDGHHAGGVHMGTHGGTTAPIHHHKRHVTVGDKISGAMMKLRGTLTRQPGVKAAGTRRMAGTDGRGTNPIL